MKRTLYSGVGLLLVGLLFLAFNLLSSLLLRDQQFDLTQQKLYTFSAGTQEVLDSLDEPLNLYLFFSKSRASDLPALRNYARRVEEVLDLYARRSHGNVRLFVIDPLPFSDDEDRAARFGLQAPPIGPNGEAIYFGLAATNPTDGLQVIPFFSPEEEPLLEYDLSRLVQALAQRERTVVGLMSSLPMAGQAPTDGQPGSRPWAVMDKLYQQFDIRTLGLASTEIPAEVSVLMLVHPRQLSEQTQYAIDQFVLRGGKLLAFVDPLSLADADGGKSSDLAPLLRSWGVQLRPDTLLADASFAMIKPNAERRPERNPTWLHLPGDTFPHDNVLTTGLESLNLASVGLLEPLGGASTRFIPLLLARRTACRCRWSASANPRRSSQRHPGPDRRTLRAGRQGRGAGDECLPRGPREARRRPERQREHPCAVGRRYGPAEQSALAPGTARPQRAAGMGGQRPVRRQCPRLSLRFGRADRPTLARPYEAPVHPRGSAPTRSRDARPGTPTRCSRASTTPTRTCAPCSNRWTPATRR